MLINVLEPEETRIAILDGDRLEELFVERDTRTKLVGNIYKGRVVSVEPSIQAAFVDFGIDKNGFLHVSDVMPIYAKGAPKNGDVRGMQSLLRVGQEVLVQVTKDVIGTKAPTLRTYISLPGRYLVLMPGVSKRGVSKKIEDDRRRRRLRAILNEIDPPQGMGYIVRTAGADRSRNDLIRDLNYLLRLWRAISKRVASVQSPVEIYRESDLVLRTIRDTFDQSIDEVCVDTSEGFETVSSFLREVMPAYAERVTLYDDPVPLFHRYKIESQIEKLYERQVPLPSGGSIVVDQTEALVAIDVNSGRSKDNDNLEETALQTNLEAADEVCRQLKLRDLGGVICVDFIDMRSDRYRQKIENRVRDLLADDRVRTRIGRMSRFCILELTRQRARMSMRRTHYQPCSHCGGAGMVKTGESMALRVVRQLRAKVATMRSPKRLEVTVHPEVASYIRSRKMDVLKELGGRIGQPVEVRSDPGLKIEELRMK